MKISSIKLLSVVLILVVCLSLFGCQKLPETFEEIQTEEDLTAFLDQLEKQYDDMCKRMGRESWNVMTGEGESDLDDIQDEFSQLMLNPLYREIVNRWRFRGSNKVKDRELRRRLVIWSRCFMGADSDGHQAIYALEQSLGERGNMFQFTLDGKPVSRADLNTIVRLDDDRDRRRQAWEVFGQLSRELEEDIQRLITMRNGNAVLFGANVDFGYLSLFVQAIELDRLNLLITELEEQTREPYSKMIASLKKVFKLEILYPWDLQYAMHNLAILPDEFFPQDQALPVLERFMGNIGFETDSYPIHISKGSDPFGAVGTIIEVPKEYRLLVDPKPGHRFCSTLFSEYGRGLYTVNIQAKRPIYKGYNWVPGAHSAAYTEAMGEIMAEFTKDPYWLSQYTQLPDDQLQQYAMTRIGFDLYSFRSLLSIISFELAAYENPLRDLGALEKKLERQFLLVDVPEDAPSRWGTMAFLVNNPVYYQNYLLSSLITAQVHQTLREKFGPRMINNKEVAQWMIDNLYADGESKAWKDRVKNATGSELTVDAYVKRFMGGGQ